MLCALGALVHQPRHTFWAIVTLKPTSHQMRYTHLTILWSHRTSGSQVHFQHLVAFILPSTTKQLLHIVFYEPCTMPSSQSEPTIPFTFKLCSNKSSAWYKLPQVQQIQAICDQVGHLDHQYFYWWCYLARPDNEWILLSSKKAMPQLPWYPGPTVFYQLLVEKRLLELKSWVEQWKLANYLVDLSANGQGFQMFFLLYYVEGPKCSNLCMHPRQMWVE